MFQLDSSHPAGAPAGTTHWSLAPTPPEALLACHPVTHHCTLTHAGQTLRTWTDPLDALAFLHPHLDDLNDPAARWVGFLNYDLGQLFESLPHHSHNDLRLPLFAFALVRAIPSAPNATSTPDTHAPPVAVSPTLPPSNFTRPAFESAVTRVLDYIRAGDIFQANLAQRLTRPVADSPAAVYARLRHHTPAWYGALLQFPPLFGEPPFALLSNSPELFLRLDPDRTLTTRPIKGTRPRLPGQDTDLRLSLKDQAELAMIVDLHRNDLGRVCTTGSVRVTEPRVIETHPTVYHGVSTITGHLREGLGLVDLLRATFPPGSVTGCPKIRAIEIIDELEPHRRNAYCGAIGYLAPGGVLQLSVAIRTMTLKSGLAHIPVGGGIVADSSPPSEYTETLVKARAMLAALEPP